MQSERLSKSIPTHISKYTPVLAVIDIGTNTLRLLIGYFEGERLVRIATERAVTRLGRDLVRTCLLHPDSIKKSITSLKKFKRKCEKYSVHKIFAVGTSALRDAKNSYNFLEQAKKYTGLDISIISGDEEADLTLKGIYCGIPPKDISLSNRSVIVDIGGGSIEWIICNKGCIKDSIPIGAVKLYETFVKHDPPLLNELNNMKSFIAEQVAMSFLKHNFDIKNLLKPFSKYLIVTGGTATTIAAVDMGLESYDGDKIHLHKISLPALKEIYKKIIMLPLNKRCKVKGLEPERADIIIPGMLILITMKGILKIKKIIISDYGLLEGILMSFKNTIPRLYQ